MKLDLQVTDVYDEPSIILLAYPLESNILPGNQTAYYLQYMTSLYVEALEQGMDNVYLLQFNGIDFPTDNWCVGHPSVAAHANMANQLIQYIENVMPDWTNCLFPQSEPEPEAEFEML